MGDLISREALFDAMREEEWQSWHPLDEVDAVIAKAPSVDAVEVVRCKECVHAVSTTNSALIKTFGEDVKVCNIHRGTLCFGAYIVSNEGFCDEGKRKECVHAVD